MHVRRSSRLAQQKLRTKGLQARPTARDDTHNADTRFEQFSQLPVELRDIIWEMAAQETSTPAVCILTVTPRTNETAAQHKPLMVHAPHNEDVAASCHRARDVALKLSPLTREYNPETDILYLDDEAFEYFTGELCGRCALPWASSVRHLAINLADAERGLHLPYAIAHMKDLETLAIVYPKTSGEVDCFARVPRPGKDGSFLRILTPWEMNALSVTADYVYDTWHSPIPVKWRLSAQGHVGYVETQLKQRCRPGNANPVPSLWDYKNARLHLTYRAMCFAS